MKTKIEIRRKLKQLREFQDVYTKAERPTPAMVIGIIETLEWVLE